MKLRIGDTESGSIFGQTGWTKRQIFWNTFNLTFQKTNSQDSVKKQAVVWPRELDEGRPSLSLYESWRPGWRQSGEAECKCTHCLESTLRRFNLNLDFCPHQTPGDPLEVLNKFLKYFNSDVDPKLDVIYFFK
jgi:hypothetical protein